MADKTLSELIAQVVDRLVTRRLKEAPFDKSYSGVISEILFEPDTPMNSSKFGAYKVKYGVSEKTVKLNDNFVHEIGERVKVTVYENNPNHIVVKPVIKRIPPQTTEYIDYTGEGTDRDNFNGMEVHEIIKKLIDENKCDKFVEYRETKTNGKTYTTEQEYKLAVLNKGKGDEEVLALIHPDGKIENYKNWNM